MAQVKGARVRFAGFTEAAFGVIPDTPAGELLYLRSMGVGGNIQRIVDETLSGRRGLSRSIAGNTDVTGDIPITLAPQSCGFWLKHLFGVINTTGVGPYAHAFSVGDLPPGFLLECDMTAAIGGTNRYIRFHGCKIAQGRLQVRPSGFPDLTLSVRGQRFTRANAALDGTLDDFGHRGFSNFVAALSLGGSPVANVTELDLTIDNDLDDSLFVIGGGGQRGELPEGFCRVSGRISSLFNSNSLLDQALADGDLALVLTWTNGTGAGTAGNEVLTVTLGDLVMEANTPRVEGPRGVRFEANFMGHRDGTDDIDLTAVLDSARAVI